MNLAPDEVHVWCVRLDVPVNLVEMHRATLPEEERIRSARLRFDHDRRRFVVAHGVLRDLLSRYLGERPEEIRFVHNEFGKPELRPGSGRDLKFNLSHSEELTLIAVGVGSDVGVDVEHVRPGTAYADIAGNFFAAEEVEALRGVSEDRYAETFLGLWTKKEAYMKARGGGFSISPASFSVTRLDGPWSLHELQPQPDYIGALAVESECRRVKVHHWTPSAALTADLSMK